MKQIGETLPALNQNGYQRESDSQTSTALKHSPKEKARLAECLTIVCALQKQYGKTENELEILVEGFSRVLRHRSMDEIIKSIEKYSLTNSGIPAPADIENIINPPPPKVDWALYIELKRRLRENIYVTSEEKRFLSECEQIGVDRMRGEVNKYHLAQKEIESQKIQMLSYEE